MQVWLKKHIPFMITLLVTGVLIIFITACEPKVQSINGTDLMVTRGELQIQLEQIISTAEFRMLELDRQEQIRAIILQNALVLVQGQPFNPLGLISGIAALYGIAQAGGNVTRTVKNIKDKRKVNNGTG